MLKMTDCEKDIANHRAAVAWNISFFIDELQKAASCHDSSKLMNPEKDAYEKCFSAIKAARYGTPEHKEATNSLGPALQHHYENNRHHPEYFGKDAIDGMTLIDIVEMLCDWKAAAERDGRSVQDSIEFIFKNKPNLKMSEQLKRILLNTAKCF